MAMISFTAVIGCLGTFKNISSKAFNNFKKGSYLQNEAKAANSNSFYSK